MKINEILEAYNKAIDIIREDKKLNVKGHFVVLEDIKKSMGPYKQLKVDILYCNVENNVNYPFAGAQLMEKCPAGTEEAMMEKCELATLTKFFYYLHNEEVFNSIISNTYDRTR